MTGDYVVGVLGLAAVVGSLGLAANVARRALLPRWSGPPAWLADAVLGFGGFIVIAELLGMVGLFIAPVFVLACLLVAAVALLGSRRAAEGNPGSAGRARAVRANPGPAVHARETPAPGAVAVPGRDGRPGGASTIRLSRPLAIGAAIALVVTLQWAALTLLAWERGIYGGDSLWYHMPFAGHIAQTGSVTELLYTDPLYLNWFYPQNSELLHAAGIELFGNDFLSSLLNMGWLGLALLAGWCLGRPYGAAVGTLAAIAALMSSELLVSRQPGNANNDVGSLALLLASAALLIEAAARGNTTVPALLPRPSPPGARREPGGSAVAGTFVAALAAGLALGTKLTVVVPVAALSIGVVAFAAAGTRARTALWWAGGLVLGGGYWYLRNLIVAGNPLPWLDLGPLPKTEELQGRDPFSIAHYLTDTDVWGTYFVPGIHERFGDLWPLLLALAVGGVVVAFLRGQRVEQLLAAVAVVSAIAYIFTPLSAAGPDGDPNAFRINIRYLAPALILALPLIALPPPFAQHFRSAWKAGVVGLFVAVIVIGNGALGDIAFGRLPGELLLAAALLVVPLAAALLLARGTPRTAVALGLVTALVVLAVVGRSTQETYLDYRYSTGAPQYPHDQHPSIQLAHGLGDANDWARGIEDARVALVGTEAAHYQYGLWGLDSSNDVRYLGRRGERGSFEGVRECPEAIEALDAGGFDYLVTSPYFDQDHPERSTLPPEHFWLERSGAERVAGGPLTEVWELPGPLGPGVCSAPRR